MLAATKCKVKMSGSEKKSDHTTYNFYSIKRVTRKFLVSRCRRAKQRQRNVQKSVLHVQSCFLLIRPTVFLLLCCFFFTVFVAVAVWLASHEFIFCFSKL